MKRGFYHIWPYLLAVACWIAALEIASDGAWHFWSWDGAFSWIAIVVGQEWFRAYLVRREDTNTILDRVAKDRGWL